MQKIRFLSKNLLLCLVVFCISIYLLDIVLGDGDGIIEKYNLNPLYIIFWSILILAPLSGIFNSVKAISNASLFLFTSIMCFIILNCFVRYFFSNAFYNDNEIINLKDQPIYTSFDTTYFKNYVPNSRFYTKSFDNKNSYYNEINSDGIRGPEIKQKPNGEKRILLVGDSFMQAD